MHTNAPRATAHVSFADVMTPAYNCNRWSAVYFILFLSIGLFFITNLVLAVAESEFKGATKTHVLHKYGVMFKGLDLAFDSLLQCSTQHSTTPRPQRPSASASARYGAVETSQPTADTLPPQLFIQFMHQLRPAMPEPFVQGLLEVFDGHVTGVTRSRFKLLLFYFANVRPLLLCTRTTPHHRAGDRQPRRGLRPVQGLAPHRQ